MKTLNENRGKIVTFDTLSKAVWGDFYYGYENSLMVHIRRRREKVEEDPSQSKFLTTARGLGYKLEKPPRPEKKKIMAKQENTRQWRMRWRKRLTAVLRCAKTESGFWKRTGAPLQSSLMGMDRRYGEEGLLVIAYPRGSIVRWNQYYERNRLDAILKYIGVFIGLNALFVFVLALLSRYRFYRSLKPVGEGVDALSEGREVHLREKGMTQYLKEKINQMSGAVTGQSGQ